MDIPGHVTKHCMTFINLEVGGLLVSEQSVVVCAAQSEDPYKRNILECIHMALETFFYELKTLFSTFILSQGLFVSVCVKHHPFCFSHNKSDDAYSKVMWSSYHCSAAPASLEMLPNKHDSHHYRKKKKEDWGSGVQQQSE